MAHQSRPAGFIIDCEGIPADEGARFWAAALGLQAQPARAEDAAEYADLLGAPAGRTLKSSASITRHGCIWTSRATTSMPKPTARRSSARDG